MKFHFPDGTKKEFSILKSDIPSNYTNVRGMSHNGNRPTEVTYSIRELSDVLEKVNSEVDIVKFKKYLAEVQQTINAPKHTGVRGIFPGNRPDPDAPIICDDVQDYIGDMSNE